MAYLYGASIQGIQEFIFKTNKLKEIVGASEIVKKINNDFKKEYKNNKDIEILLNAAGNIKAIFKSKDLCKKFVEKFPKRIMQKAYGITISQAVVHFEGEFNTKTHISELEKKLKEQRNKPTLPLDMSINIMKLNPNTSSPLVSNVDKSTQQKQEANTALFKKNQQNKEVKEISTLSNGKNKIAVIHADGNGLGQLIQKLKEKLNIELSEFSQKLDSATKKAFEDAKSEKMQIREVILGGDDLAIICNANDALEFTKKFLENFEKETKEALGYKLTACAGIAYCNEKYPFHYAIALAEELCSQTKKHAKNIDLDLAPSSLMFHNIQSSNFQTWEKFVEDELTIINDQEIIRCDFGPYYINQKGEPTIQNLIHMIEAYRCDNSPISKLRAWLTELNKSQQYADNMLVRINEIAKQSKEWNSCIMNKNLKEFNQNLSNEEMIIKKDNMNKTPIYDVLQILSATEVTK